MEENIESLHHCPFLGEPLSNHGAKSVSISCLHITGDFLTRNHIYSQFTAIMFNQTQIFFMWLNVNLATIFYRKDCQMFLVDIFCFITCVLFQNGQTILHVQWVKPSVYVSKQLSLLTASYLMSWYMPSYGCFNTDTFPKENRQFERGSVYFSHW